MLKISEILQKLSTDIGKWQRFGRWQADCPFCGKEAKKSQNHFGFNSAGYRCWVCGVTGTLPMLYNKVYKIRVSVDSIEYDVEKVLDAEHREKAEWLQYSREYLDSFISHPRRDLLWKQYKPVNAETIEEFELGVGILPGVSKKLCSHERLIYPVYAGKEIVAFRGRSIYCDCPKWLSSGGSQTTLWGQNMLFHRCFVLLCENPVDAMLVYQQDYTSELAERFFKRLFRKGLTPDLPETFLPGIVAVASTAGASTWDETWTLLLKKHRPIGAMIMFDNDLAGSPNIASYTALVNQWKQEHPDTDYTPFPGASKIAGQLMTYGIPTVISPITDLSNRRNTVPAKYDIGRCIQNEACCKI